MDAKPLVERFKIHLRYITRSGTNLLESLQDEANSYKSSVTDEEVLQIIQHHIDAWNAGNYDGLNNQKSIWRLSNPEDVVQCVRFRLSDLHWKIRRLEQIPGQELELGFAYLERELLEDFLYKVD
jgi:hypothetical protein